MVALLTVPFTHDILIKSSDIVITICRLYHHLDCWMDDTVCFGNVFMIMFIMLIKRKINPCLDLEQKMYINKENIAKKPTQ